MKKAGCGLAILGVVLLGVSFALFGSSIFKAMAAREAAVAPVVPGMPADTGVAAVATDKLCRVALRGTVRSGHARRGAGADDSWELRYAFPFRYTVYDEAGAILHEEERDFASDGGGVARTSSQARVTAEGGSVRVEHGFEKFAVPPPGNVRVVARLENDADFGASFEGAEIVLYDQVSRHAKRVGFGVALFAVGGFALFAGAALFIFAALRNARA